MTVLNIVFSRSNQLNHLKILLSLTVSLLFQLTKSKGRLNPPFLFMYCRYLRFRITCTSPVLLFSTFLFLVVSNPQKPMVFIISCSSRVFPSRSSALTALVRLSVILDFEDDGSGERCLLSNGDLDLE